MVHANDQTEVTLDAIKTKFQTSSNGLESQEMKVQWSGYQLEAHWFKYISLKLDLFIYTGL